MTTWDQFRGRLGPHHYLSLLLENAAVKSPIPFDAGRVVGIPGVAERLGPEEGQRILTEARAQGTALPGADYVQAQAKRLGISTRLARAELHVVKAHQRVLELPGSGGQLAHHLTQKHDLPFREVFTLACADWREQTLAGIVALECRVVGDARIRIDPDLAESRSEAFDFVIGLAPEKGGRFERRLLEGYFPKATVILV
jgi:hypothetical protein